MLIALRILAAYSPAGNATHDGAARRQAAWLFGGNVRYSCSTRQHNQLASLNVSIELIKSSAVGDKATVLRNFGD